MDDIVKAAIAKWPNVPDCKGWLSLDRRGQWRMRDEGAQARGELGTPIRHAALIGFIERNYERDGEGRCFFQNGPQRVFVELAYTPWIVRLALPVAGEPALTDHTGAPFDPAGVLLDDEGGVLFVDTSLPARVALLHDHDLELFTQLAALDAGGSAGIFTWRAGEKFAIEPVERTQVPRRFAFVTSPAASAPASG